MPVVLSTLWFMQQWVNHSETNSWKYSIVNYSAVLRKSTWKYAITEWILLFYCVSNETANLSAKKTDANAEDFKTAFENKLSFHHNLA